MPFDYSHIQFSRPVDKVKTINVEPIPQRIFNDMSQYEDAARGFALIGFDHLVTAADPTHVTVLHRPADAQVAQLYRMPADTTSTDLERLTHFDIDAGRTISQFQSIAGEDWRGRWRAGGAIMVMDLDGNENSQLWRYWEDGQSEHIFPNIDGELDNRPGKGRIECLTHCGSRYTNVIVSESNRLLAFSSDKENGTDTLVYIAKLVDSKAGGQSDSKPFTLPSTLVTPGMGRGTSRWTAGSISIDDTYLLLIKAYSSAYRSMYIVNISGAVPSTPELIILPHSTEEKEETSFTHPAFSRNPATPHLIYLITNAYGDFNSVITYDIVTHVVVHVTTPEPNLHALRPIAWEVHHLKVTRESVFFCANVEGWSSLFVMPLSGMHRNTIVEVKLDWEGGEITYQTNARNGKPNELALKLVSHRSQGYIVHMNIAEELERIKTDENGDKYIEAKVTEYRQAAAAIPKYTTLPAKLLRYKSFDGMEIPVMYYHPSGGKSAVPVVINIHGGPESQSTSQSRIPIHWYLINELGCAVMYPNVRGSSGYGKRFMAADDVKKREDSVKDIGALLDHIDKLMKSELDSARIAVMGGSYGGYMVYTCLTHFSPKLACGLANFGIAHWPSFLENTASHRRDARRREYGDETVPEIREFLESISPLNHASKISVPLSIAHGETDSRVTVEEAIRMWDIVSKGGVYVELMVCEKEGHGFKQKSVIEFTNAAKIRFLERFLLGV